MSKLKSFKEYANERQFSTSNLEKLDRIKTLKELKGYKSLYNIYLKFIDNESYLIKTKQESKGKEESIVKSNSKNKKGVYKESKYNNYLKFKKKEESTKKDLSKKEESIKNNYKKSKQTSKVQKTTNDILNEKINISKAQIRLINKEVVVFTKDKQIFDLLDNRLLGGDSYYTSCFINLCNLIKNQKIDYIITEIDNRLVAKLNREQIKQVFQIEKYKFRADRLFQKINATEVKRLSIDKNDNELILIQSHPLLISGRVEDFKKVLNITNNKGEYIKGIKEISLNIDYYYINKLLESESGSNYFTFYKDFYEIVFTHLDSLGNSNSLKVDTDYIYKVFFSLFHHYNNQKDKNKGYFKLDNDLIYKFIQDANFQYSRKQNSIDFHKIKDLKEKLNLNEKGSDILASESIDILIENLNKAIEIGNTSISKYYKSKKQSEPDLPRFLPKTKIENDKLIFYYENKHLLE